MSWKAAGGNNGTAISGIPPASRKVVQSLKEIVSCPESEIYAMLKDCNMDPNDAVNRLLSQDPFHEVKSKREKKKENKETTDYRPRGPINALSRGGRAGADRNVGRGGGTQFSLKESGSSYSKPAYKKENGTHTYAGSSSPASGITGNIMNWQLPSHSDAVATESKVFSGSSGDGILSSSQPSSGFQSAWFGAPGQKTMADIVKMGRPQSRDFTVTNPLHHNVNNNHITSPPSSTPHHDFHLSQDHAPKVSEIDNEQESSASHHAIDEWPLIESRPAAAMSGLEVPEDSQIYTDPSNLPSDRISQHLAEVQVVEDDPVETIDANDVGSASISSRNIQEDVSRGSSLFDNNLYNMDSYQAQRHSFKHNESEDAASAVVENLQQLSIQTDERVAPAREDMPSVVIPNHLQVHTPDCSHLSFGSFGTGIGSGYSGSFVSGPLDDNLGETSEAVDASSIDQSDARNPEYYGDEHLGRSTSDGNMVHRTNASVGNFESTSDSQAEVLKPEAPEASQEHQYTFTSSAPGYTYENSQQLNAAFVQQPTNSQIQNFAQQQANSQIQNFAQQQANSQIQNLAQQHANSQIQNLAQQQAMSQMQNLAQLSSVMQTYPNSLPSNLLASNVQPAREPEFQYSPFPVSQSMPTKYNSSASSIGGPTNSMPEALRAGGVPTPQPTPQALAGATVAAGPALQQHLAMHPYSQPTLPLGHFANMIGYPFLPQSYTYMPSAFQQAFAGNSTYHQSLAAVLPQYKTSASVSNLPQSAAIASGYGFGSSSSIPGGNFPPNAPTAPAGTTIGYDDVLSSQYKDTNHMMSLQQNENSGMWVQGPGSRTMSGVPANTYYSFQGQNQQAAAFRQAQQPSQHFSQLGYPNFYHSQAGISLEQQQQQQQQNPRDGSQSQPSTNKQNSQQLWQNSY